MTELQIQNKALRLLGLARVTQADLDGDLTEQARILNDIYDSIRDEALSAHPWNFAIKQSNLTELGGLITTWTEEGTDNVWQADLTTQPAEVLFNGTEGTEVASVAACTAAGYWYWYDDVLYVYSTSDPDDAYDSPGIDAIIAEFEFSNAFALPTDCLRVIRMESDTAVFKIKGDRLFTDEDEAKIEYIAQITDPDTYSPAFIAALTQRLAAEMTIPTTNQPKLAQVAYQLYIDKKREAKGINAQEGTGTSIAESSWIDSRNE